jgi:acyl-CoA synthetase (AMP-forming)/AMP-acid ligase II
MTDAPHAMTDAELRRHGLIPPPARVAIPGSPQSVAGLLEPALAARAQSPALVGRHARYTFAELDLEVNRAANALRALGIEAGERVAGSMGNHTELAVAFLAAMRLGALWVGVSRALAPPEKQYVLRDSGARVLLADREARAQLEPLRAGLPDLAHLIDAEPGAENEWTGQLARAASARPRVEIDPFAPAAIAYTSGTTGLPKGAVHSQHNLLLPGAIALYKGRSGPEIAQGVCLPLTLLNLMVLGPVLSGQAQSKCVLMDRIDALGVAEWVAREKIVSFASVPTTFHDLLTHPEVKWEDLASLTRPAVGGAPPPEELKALFLARFGFEIQEGYGMTEAPTSVAQSDASRPRIPGSCGQALPHQWITIRDDAGAELPAGEVGEVCVAPRSSGPWAQVYTPMLGYWNRPEASAEALRGGMLHTGDLGRLDTQGNLYIVDRRSELILRGGANVYPAEVERALHADARVAECAVLSIPDTRLGERVVAAVQLARGAQASAEELQNHCRSQLARYKVPERIVFVDAFPRNAMNKILKRELRALFQQGARDR